MSIHEQKYLQIIYAFITHGRYNGKFIYIQFYALYKWDATSIIGFAFGLTLNFETKFTVHIERTESFGTD